MNKPETNPELDRVFQLLLDGHTELEQLTERQQTLFNDWFAKLILLWQSQP